MLLFFAIGYGPFNRGRRTAAQRNTLFLTPHKKKESMHT